MRMLTALFLIASVFAAPCVLDAGSSEPSPLAGIVSAVTG